MTNDSCRLPPDWGYNPATLMRSKAQLSSKQVLALVIFFSFLTTSATASSELPANYVAGDLIVLNDSGAWSWFMDERVIVHNGKLIVGSVRAVGDFRNNTDPDWGNVEISVYDLASKSVERTVFHKHFEQDDHDGPAFLPLPDGRYLAFYTKHGVERRIYYRFSEPGNPLVWSNAFEFETPGVDAANFRGDNVTYSNLFRFPSGRIYNFFRGPSHDPNYMYSDDGGRTWSYGGRLLHGRGGYSPYLKYVYDGKSTIHFVTTEDHPRNYDNSIYHGFIRDGVVYFSDGKPRAKLSVNTQTEIAAWDLTKVFQGDYNNVGWVIDIELDRQQRPYFLFSVHKGGRLPRGQGGTDHRYGYARWDGRAWRVHEIAYAGTRLYPNEDDYTGLAALDPNDRNVVYISTDADPVSGAPLISRADGKRHHELYRGTTRNSGAKWKWEPITANSNVDNLRPIVPKWQDSRKAQESRKAQGQDSSKAQGQDSRKAQGQDSRKAQGQDSRKAQGQDSRTALVWMRGKYESNRGKWSTAVVALIFLQKEEVLERSAFLPLSASPPLPSSRPRVSRLRVLCVN